MPDPTSVHDQPVDFPPRVGNPFAEPVPESTAQFWLAFLLVAGDMLLLLALNYIPLPPHLSPEIVSRSMQGINDLAKVAVIYFFVKMASK
jgi:hypothetical protein